MAAPLEHYAGMTSHQGYTTPGEADRILRTQNWRRQRLISPGWVRKLRLAITKGELTFLTLVFAEMPDGSRHLVDGQHRLTALIGTGKTLPTTVITHRVLNETQLGELYLQYDRPRSRGPEVGLRALGVFEESDLPEKFVARMGGAVYIIRSGFSRSYRQDSSLIERTYSVRDWLGEIALYHKALAGTGTTARAKLMRAAVAAVALVTFRHHPAVAEEFWTRTATQEMLALDDPRYRLMAWLTDNTVTRNDLKGGDILYAKYVATAWNAFFERRPLKLLKVADAASPIKITGIPIREYEGAAPYESL